jgi:hypothetical protein
VFVVRLCDACDVCVGAPRGIAAVHDTDRRLDVLRERQRGDGPIGKETVMGAAIALVSLILLAVLVVTAVVSAALVSQLV